MNSKLRIPLCWKAATTTFRDIDLGVDTTYRYRVRAIDGPRESRASREATVATPLLCLS